MHDSTILYSRQSPLVIILLVAQSVIILLGFMFMFFMPTGMLEPTLGCICPSNWRTLFGCANISFSWYFFTACEHHNWYNCYPFFMSTIFVVNYWKATCLVLHIMLQNINIRLQCDQCHIKHYELPFGKTPHGYTTVVIVVRTR